MLAAIEANGGLADLIAEHQALAAQHGDNYLPLLERFYRSSRASLIRLASVLKLESTTTDRRLLDAVEFVKATSSRTGEYIPDSCTIIDDQTGEARRVEVDAGFAPEAWQKVVRDRRRPGKLVRRLFEICVFSCLADELVRGDVASAMSETYANWQAQLLSWEACQPYLAGYCEEVGLPPTAAEFCQGLRQQMKELAINVDAGYPDNADLLMDDEGRPSLKARKGKERTASALALEAAVKDRLPERSLLEILGRATRWLRWYRHLGPLSGSDPKLADPLERYLLVAFTYGCNLGPHQAARHLAGLVTAHELSSTARRHVSLTSLNKAIGDVVNAYLELDLPKMWGDGNGVATDGTQYDIYVDNLIAEYHIRYGGYGGIAYHYIADNYIALFSRFFPCGVWEAVYIVEGLLQQESKAAPKEIHADTQGQSFPVFGLAYLFGFDLLPRIRNFKDRTFYRPEPGVTYTHIDALFGDPVNWKLIEEHCSLVKPIVGLKRVGSGELAGGAAVLRNGSHRGRVITRSGARGDCTTSPVEHRSASRPDDGRAGLTTCRRRVQS